MKAEICSSLIGLIVAEGEKLDDYKKTEAQI
jgi:hypothetical protein